MSTWDHRVFKNETVSADDPLYEFVEAHYDDDDKLTGWGEPFMVSETLDGLTELLERLQEALSKPVLTATDLFTEEQ